MRILEVGLPGCPSPGLLRLPDGAVRAGVVALPGASAPARRQPLFTHLSETVAPVGFAVLSFDRRPAERGGDTPLDVQARDALAAAAVLADAVQRPWFALVHLPATLPAEGARWADMDYDPCPSLAGVRCPTLAMYGEDEETVPAEVSKDAWRQAAMASGNGDVSIVDLPGCGHFPASPDQQDQVSSIAVADISPAYTAALRGWFAHRP